MSLRDDLAKAANEAGRKSRRGGAPRLTAASTASAIAEWLQWNDPNGEHTAARRRRADVDPYTVTEAWEQVAEMVDPNYTIEMKWLAPKSKAILAELDEERSLGQEIIDAMARTMFVVAWGDYEEEHGRSHGGRDLMDVAPSTPPHVYDEAQKLAIAFETENVGANVTDLMMRAEEADGEEPEPNVFGYYLVMQALGHGVSWFDDHKRFPIKFPRFEAHWDGERLYTSGLDKLVPNPAKDPSLREARKMVIYLHKKQGKDVGDAIDETIRRLRLTDEEGERLLSTIGAYVRPEKNPSSRPIRVGTTPARVDRDPSGEEYTFFVVTKDNRIFSAWSYKADAEENRRDADETGSRGLRVLSRAGVKRLGVDPQDESNWVKSGNKFDRWNMED
jgi:hypothetical protein